jgi:transposase-like protein
MDKPKKAKRSWTAEQKFNILQEIDADIKSGMKVGDALAKHGLFSSVYSSWKKQLAVGVKSSLRSGKPPVDKEKRRLEREIEKLKAIVLSQSQMIADLKKETNWD